MINPQNGFLNINGHIIQPGMSLNNLKTYKLSEHQEFNDMQNGSGWLNVKNMTCEGLYFCANFYFEDDKFLFVIFVVSDQEYDLNASWDDVTEESENENMKFYQAWVIKELGREGEFDWGTIETCLDCKNGTYDIVLRYKK